MKPKAKKLKMLFVKRIEWGNPYTSPPDGRPRILAEVVVEHPLDNEEELARHHPGFGKGYSFTHRALLPPPRTVAPEIKAERRRKALAKKMEKRYPLFAQEFTNERIGQKPDYYIDGRGQWEEEKAEIIRQQVAYYAEASQRIGVVVVFEETPQT